MRPDACGVAMVEYTYKAFISYSWADATWGKWLQHAVETYRTPKALIEKHAPAREIPARLTPLFKDREEQAAGASIGASIEAALADSEFLIVICSPNSAKSQWVNHEIAWFKTNRDPDKILALIVDGEPGDAERECFPKALTHSIAPDLTITDTPDEAPLAADAREGGDGKRLAKMKLVAAMLGVGLDQLLRRDDRRRVLRARVIAGASLALALVMSGLTWFAVEQRNEADRQRAEADGLIEFMLTDLREKLEPVGRLDALDVVGQRALTYYAGQNPGSLDADSLGRRARALLLVGEITNIRGNSEEALQAFTQAAATIEEQLARDPDNEQRIFDHAQSVFWVGAIAYGRGELENAEAQFREYKRLADRLIELNPDKPEWQMESSYAETNLGAMFIEQGRFAEAEPAFETGLLRIEAVAAREAYEPGRQIEVGNAMNWLGTTKDALGKISEANAIFLREVELYDSLLTDQPTNAQAMNRLSVALQLLGSVQLRSGRLDAAITSLRRSIRLNAQLRSIEPDNIEWQETAVLSHFELASHLLFAERTAESRSVAVKAGVLLEKLIAKNPENTNWSQYLQLRQILHSTRLEWVSGNRRKAEQLSAEMVKLAHSTAEGNASNLYALAHLLAGDIELAQGRPDQAELIWQSAIEALPDHSGMDDERYRLLKRLGKIKEAEALSVELDKRGYRHPAYLSEKQN